VGLLTSLTNLDLCKQHHCCVLYLQAE